MSSAPPGFYVTGGTLSGDASCYVPRQADQALFDGLKRGEFCYFRNRERPRPRSG